MGNSISPFKGLRNKTNESNHVEYCAALGKKGGQKKQTKEPKDAGKASKDAKPYAKGSKKNPAMEGIEKIVESKHVKNTNEFQAQDDLHKTSFGPAEPTGKAGIPPGYRSTPEITKTSALGQNAHLFAGFSCMQGWKETQEDVPVGLLALSEDKKASYFAVFDGHRGSKVSAGLGKAMHKYICQNQYYKAGKYEDAITEGFLTCDADLRNIEALKEHMCGSTACVCLLKNSCEDIYVGNAGDSRIFYCADGKAIALSDDHKPFKPIEKARIEKAGGFVQNGRVNGRLAVARSMGDFDYKADTSRNQTEQLITSNPDVISRKVTDDWDFIMLGSDGIFDVLTNQEVANFIMSGIAEGHRPDKICENLMSHCMAEFLGQPGGSHDNMTVILACFLHNRTYEDLIQKCKKWAERNEKESITTTTIGQ